MLYNDTWTTTVPLPCSRFVSNSQRCFGRSSSNFTNCSPRLGWSSRRSFFGNPQTRWFTYYNHKQIMINLCIVVVQYRPANRKHLFGRSLRPLFSAQGPGHFLNLDSYRPEVLKRVFVFVISFFLLDVRKRCPLLGIICDVECCELHALLPADTTSKLRPMA